MDDGMNSGLTNDQLDLQSRVKAGKYIHKVKNSEPIWSGRKSKATLQNAGSDVVKAFQENLNEQKRKVVGLNIEPSTKAGQEDVSRCDDNCRGVQILSKKWTCILNCATKNKGPVSEGADILFYGIKTLCHTVSTFYATFDQLDVKNLETFQAVMTRVESLVPVSSNVPLKSMLVKHSGCFYKYGSLSTTSKTV